MFGPIHNYGLVEADEPSLYSRRDKHRLFLFSQCFLRILFIKAKALSKLFSIMEVYFGSMFLNIALSLAFL